MPIDDPQQFEKALARQRELLTESDKIHDADREAIRRWMRSKDGSVKISSLKTYLRRLRNASERSDVPLVEFDEATYNEWVFSMRHDHDLADSTVKSYEDVVTQFLAEELGVEWPNEVDRTTVERSTISADQMLTASDIQQLTQSARSQRDVALIEFFADTGARLSMALSLRVGDVDLNNPPTYTPNENALGLKDAPTTAYPLIDSVAAIRSYLRTSHPRPDDSGVALFHKQRPHARGDDGERWTDRGSLNPNACQQQLRRVAARADVEKPVNPHNFRHSAVTRMSREGFTRSQIEHRVHWTIDSEMWERYEHIASEQHNHDIFTEAGLIEGDQSPDRVRRPCGQCREPLAPHHEFCPNCGEPVTEAARQEVDEAEDSVLAELVERTNPVTRRELRALLDELESDPTLAHDDPSRSR